MSMRAGSELRKQRPNIYDFHDYRKFLADYLAWQRSMEPREYSLRKVAEKAGVTSAFLSYVLNGHRNMSPKGMKKLVPVLKLNDSEVSFFKQLIILADSPKVEERKKALERLQTFPTYKRLHQDDKQSYGFLQNWYTAAIHQMVDLDDFRLDPEWIRAQLNASIPLSEVKKSIGFLFDNGYLKINKEGEIEKHEQLLDCTGGVYKVALETFHSQMNDLAIETISTTPRDERIIEGFTFSMSENDIPKVKEVIVETLERIVKMTRKMNKDVNRVFHVSLAGFPVVRVQDSDDEPTSK